MSNHDEQKPNASQNLLVQSLGILPQNLLSLMVGATTRAKLPTVLSKPLNKAFVKAFKINMAEAERPLADYATIEDVFTRKLQIGSRKVASGFASPSDGTIVRSEPSVNGQAVQVKGIEYSLKELVFGQETLDKESNQDFNPGWFSTVYLAPYNYHRVHAPLGGTVDCLRYIPGRLWPVNTPAVKAIPGLFCRNERLVFDFKVDGLGEGISGRAWVVMVGALNVGRIVTPLAKDFVSNSADRQLGKSGPIETKISSKLAIGDELGTFMLGSTVVVVLDEALTNFLNPKRLENQQPIKMGQSLIQ